MAKSRYSSSKKGKSRRSRRSRHTKRHSRRHPHHTRRRGRGRGRGHRGGANNPGPPEIMWPLKPNQLLPGLPNYQRGGGSSSCPSRGFELSTGGSASNKGTAWNFQNPAGGRS